MILKEKDKMNKGNMFIIGFILGLITAFIIAAYYYETGKNTIKRENKAIYYYEEKTEKMIKI